MILEEMKTKQNYLLKVNQINFLIQDFFYSFFNFPFVTTAESLAGT